MNLIKWLRKNNQKIMAVVVIILMFAFVGGSALSYVLRSNREVYRAVAYFDDNNKITPSDEFAARHELDILRALRASALLRSQDLRGMLLSELVLSEGRGSPEMMNYMKRAVRTNQYRVTDRQIEDIYRRSATTDIYWMLLKHEARRAGISVPNKDVRELLGRVIPQLFERQTYSRVMTSMVSQYGVPEEQILSTLGELLAVLQYAYVICSTQDVTDSQVRHAASWESETVDVEYVRFDSSVFAKAADKSSEKEMVTQFDRYKKSFAGEISAENPYAFGYKLPDRVQLEYIAVKLDDISLTVKPPTEEEAEEYYQKSREQLFTEQVPKDPNDPNSPLISRTRSYAEVSGSILDQLLSERINGKAEQILQEAKSLTDGALESAAGEDVNLTGEQLKKLAGDYKAVAEQLSKKYAVKLYSGQTGLLSGVDVQADERLGRLYVMQFGYNAVRLSQIVFSVGVLEPNQPSPLYMQRPRMYESIGPAKDVLGETKNASGQIMALVRLIDVQKAREPESIDVSFSTRTLELEPAKQPENKSIHSVRDKVIEDLKRLAVLDATKNKAQEFIGLAAKDGWDIAIKKFNELYGKESGGKNNSPDVNDPNVFRLEGRKNLRRIPSSRLEILAAQTAGNPVARLILDEARAEGQFIDQLYLLVPQDSNTVKSGYSGLVLEFKPNLSFYCLKNVSVRRLSQEEYQTIKARRVNREEEVQSQSLAAVHFNPDNILKRMNFRPAKGKPRTVDVSPPPEVEVEL